MVKCFLPEDIAKKIVFIDAITRSGKSIFDHIIPSLEGLEHIQYNSLIEQIVPAFSLGLIEETYAKAQIRAWLNELAYNIKLSRNVNFRNNDRSSVLFYRQPEIYKERLSRKDGDDVVNELRIDKGMIPIHTHDLLANLKSFEAMEIDYKIIALYRHPVDTAYSWWKRGWGERFGVDPRHFGFTLEYKGRVMPWYCAGHEKEWLSLNPAERCVHTSMLMTRRSLKEYKTSRSKKKIHLVTFEDFVQNTPEEVEKICVFLKTKPTKHTKDFISKEGCPKFIDVKSREKKITEFQANIDKKFLDELVKMSQSFEDGLYGLRRKNLTYAG